MCAQLAAGERHITGVMVESHINAGRQDVPPEGPSALKHGVSITDACVDWATTVEMLDKLNQVRGSFVAPAWLGVLMRARVGGEAAEDALHRGGAQEARGVPARHELVSEWRRTQRRRRKKKLVRRRREGVPV